MEKDHTMKKTRGWSAMILPILWLLLVADVTTAGDVSLPPFGVFTMLEGQGVEVCEACFKALEAAASGPDQVGLSGCERNYDVGLGFSAHAWKELDPLKQLTLLKQVMLFLRPIEKDKIPGSIYDGDNFKREIKTEMKHERIAVSMVMIDIDNDGRAEPVFKYRDGTCGNPQNRSATRAILVLNRDRKSIDQIKTDVVTQNDGKRPGHPAGNEQIYDIFSYKGRVYFDRWNNGGLEPDTFSVYQAMGNKVSRLCKYRYERRYRSEIPGGTR